ncbi:sugar O-acetyltransferase [Schleiferilactobacillus shenzhenensis]|uniref:Acetyltransferase n=1 Tax=Schleiferilactobacillus shenzhenensis LY-73 TaxID=1231336 RepID=U4TPZ4_9LACO|nr:sugar O-acetyltransferase [Schleiferilactobacillus shenzhenensis]ERL63958.1 LacA [Schleiferilactobacillus shenzhenensis LY-73]
MTTERDKMHTGDLYLPNDDQIMHEQMRALDKLYDYNQTRPSDTAQRAALLTEMFAEIGANCYIEPPLHANWAGHFAHFGHDIYANFNLTLVDDTRITVGDYTMFGPNVVLATGSHPVLPELRAKAYQYNLPITIGRNCWLGAGVIVMPGVTIGDNTVIGAGSIVTRDVPANVVAYGNPCRVQRDIGKLDKEFYWRDKAIDWTAIAPDKP